MIYVCQLLLVCSLYCSSWIGAMEELHDMPQQSKMVAYWFAAKKDVTKIIDLRQKDKSTISSLDSILMHEDRYFSTTIFFESNISVPIVVDLERAIICEQIRIDPSTSKHLIDRLAKADNYSFGGKQYYLKIRDHKTDNYFSICSDCFDCDVHEGIAIVKTKDYHWSLFKTNIEQDEEGAEVIVLEYMRALPLFSGKLFRAHIVHGYIVFIMCDGRIIVVSPEITQDQKK